MLNTPFASAKVAWQNLILLCHSIAVCARPAPLAQNETCSNALSAWKSSKSAAFGKPAIALPACAKPNLTYSPGYSRLDRFIVGPEDKPVLPFLLQWPFGCKNSWLTREWPRAERASKSSSMDG